MWRFEGMNTDEKYVECNKATVFTIQRRVKRLISLLEKYSSLIDAYVLDFFVASHWNTLPRSWQLDLEDLEPTELAEFISNDERKCVKKVQSLSLLAFKATMYAESLPRDFIKSPQPISDFVEHSVINMPQCAKSNLSNSNDRLGLNYFSENEDWRMTAGEELSQAGGQHKRLHHILRRHIKPKKQHEIMRLLKAITLVTDKMNCDGIVDVGSGQGHLSRLLAFSTNLHVTSMEAESRHISGAKKIDDQVLKNFEKENKKQLDNIEKSVPTRSALANLPNHVKSFIPSNISNDEFIELLHKSCTDNNLEHYAPDSHFSLVGLHTCGNLAATLLKVFARCSDAVALFSVACCYMKLDEEMLLNSSRGEERNYPLSKFVREEPHHHLSYVAREVACHAIEKYGEKLKGNALALKIHCYRATLEALIVTQYPEMKHLGLRSIKRAHEMPFSVYSQEALKKTNITVTESDLTSPYVENCTRQWKRVLAFYSLRLLLAMVVESVILLDRMLYLFEEGIDSCLIPLFDPHISPRNHVLIAIKRHIE